MADYVGFEDSLEDDDYGLIIGRDGTVKGIWIPSHVEDTEIPSSVVKLIKASLGIDISDPKSYPTIH